jgi:hypothetical protein
MGLMKKLEDIFSAVAFAEAGEFDTARQILKEAGHSDAATEEKDIRVQRDDTESTVAVTGK